MMTEDADPMPVRVVLTGQSMIQSDIRVGAPALVEQMRTLLRGDVVFTNFESTLYPEGDRPVATGPSSTVYAPPEALDALQELGFNLLALPNNHAPNLGVPGILNTLRGVKSRDLAHAGIGEDLDEALAPGYLSTTNGRVALVAMASGLIPPELRATSSTPGVNELRLVDGTPGVDAGRPHPEDADRILSSIRSAASNADLVIAYHHNHVFDANMKELLEERRPERFIPPRWIQEWAHRQVEAGADIVVVHGIPVLQAMEVFQGRPIFYGLGNFMFEYPALAERLEALDPIWKDSAVVDVTFENRSLRSVTFQPIQLNHEPGDGGMPEAERGLPRAAHGPIADGILQRLVESSEQFGAQIKINGEIAELVN